MNGTEGVSFFAHLQRCLSNQSPTKPQLNSTCYWCLIIPVVICQSAKGTVSWESKQTLSLKSDHCSREPFSTSPLPSKFFESTNQLAHACVAVFLNLMLQILNLCLCSERVICLLHPLLAALQRHSRLGRCRQTTTRNQPLQFDMQLGARQTIILGNLVN